MSSTACDDQLTVHPDDQAKQASNPLSDFYVNAVAQEHGYAHPLSTLARLDQWIGLHGKEDSITLLIWESQKVIRELLKDKERLDSGCIITQERDDFGDEHSCERRGLDLRAAIDAAIAESRK
ncbi:hypothetical protein [Advenella mimigardefordensis]|uniref:hypothetical protein n=1 Tax=Advenella mimigardefordensis TaxID=302406 RepID=UPI00046CFC1D|nr:hypothetical protein [Advenella mimigardefordensis]